MASDLWDTLYISNRNMIINIVQEGILNAATADWV
jgi:hypothetical protein